MFKKLIVTAFIFCVFIGWHCTGPTGPQGIPGSDGLPGPEGPTGPEGPPGSQTRVGVHVITFGDPTDTSAPNSGGVFINGVIIWDTVTTVPGVFTVRIPGIDHPDDVIEVFLGGGSKGLLRHHFEAEMDSSYGSSDIIFDSDSNEFIRLGEHKYFIESASISTDRVYIYDELTDTWKREGT